MDHIRKSTNTDNLSSTAYNKSNGRSKENESREKQREIINLTAMFEGEKNMAFPGLQKIQRLAKSQLQCYLQLRFCFFFFFFLWVCLETCYSGTYYNLPCPQQKNYIQLSSNYLFMEIVMHCFLPLEDSMTLKHCSIQKVQEQSKPN